MRMEIGRDLEGYDFILFLMLIIGQSFFSHLTTWSRCGGEPMQFIVVVSMTFHGSYGGNVVAKRDKRLRTYAVEEK